MENKISEYMEMEEEFEEMKTKLKYEEGRFLKNDRKDNEIIIIRGENSNLKHSIKKLEEKINILEKDKEEKNKMINELQESLKKFKVKFKDLQKQNEILNAHCINININNVNGNNNKNGNTYNTNNINTPNLNSPKNSENTLTKNKMAYFQKINKKLVSNKIYKAEVLNNTRNESLERTKSDLLNKYFISNKINKTNNMLLNNSAVKLNSFQYGNNKQLNLNNHNELPIPVFSNRINLNNYSHIKKNPVAGLNSSRSNSTKIKGKPNKIINYKYLL
jgi:hypothetical protein